MKFGMTFGMKDSIKGGMAFGMKSGMLHALVVVALAGIPSGFARADDSDKNQPATLDADAFELDLETGVRTYRGHVVYQQGSLQLKCDALVTYYHDDNKLNKGVCTGNPGRFKQRPEGQDSDIIGRARVITLDRIKGAVILQKRAEIEQGGNRIHGQLITYHLATKKVKVTGAGDAASAEVASADSNAQESTQESAQEPAQESTLNATARPRLIIQPRKTKQN